MRVIASYIFISIVKIAFLLLFRWTNMQWWITKPLTILTLIITASMQPSVTYKCVIFIVLSHIKYTVLL